MYRFRELLRAFRKAKKLSQLELSAEAGISSRHLSFLETGKSNPSRNIISIFSKILDVTNFQKNLLLTSAGYIEEKEYGVLHKPDRGGIENALIMMIENHNPYPAIVIDKSWNLIFSNDSFQKLIRGILMVEPNFSSSKNIMELIFDTKGLRPFITNWDSVAYACLQRLHREDLENRGLHTELLDLISNKYGCNIGDINFNEDPDAILCFELSIRNISLKFITTLTSFGTSIDLSSRGIMIEHYYPADDVTKIFFEMNQSNDNVNSTLKCITEDFGSLQSPCESSNG